MYFSHPQVAFQEVPGEISLAFSISGCNIGCNGCHSIDTWNPTYGKELTKNVFIDWINKYPDMITSVLFYGGEWEPKILSNLLAIAHQRQLKTALYTGLELESIPRLLLKNLTFIKSLGGINRPHSNQRFFYVQTGEDLTSLFHTIDTLIPVSNL